MKKNVKGSDAKMTRTKVKRPSSYAECAFQLWERVQQIARETTDGVSVPLVGEDEVQRSGLRIEGIDLKGVMVELWGLKTQEIERVTQQARRAAGKGQAEAVRNLVSGRGDSAHAVWWVADQWPARAIYQPPSVRQVETVSPEMPVSVGADSAESNGPPEVADDNDDTEPLHDVPLPDVDDLRMNALTAIDQIRLRYEHDLKEAKEELELLRAQNLALRKSGLMAFWTLGEVLGVPNPDTAAEETAP